MLMYGDARRALPAGRPARITREALETYGFAHAQRIVDYRGSHFRGTPRPNHPGVDG